VFTFPKDFRAAAPPRRGPRARQGAHAGGGARDGGDARERETDGRAREEGPGASARGANAARTRDGPSPGTRRATVPIVRWWGVGWRPPRAAVAGEPARLSASVSTWSIDFPAGVGTSQTTSRRSRSGPRTGSPSSRITGRDHRTRLGTPGRAPALSRRWDHEGERLGPRWRTSSTGFGSPKRPEDGPREDVLEAPVSSLAARTRRGVRRSAGPDPASRRARDRSARWRRRCARGRRS